MANHTTPQVHELTGASFRQIDWWARHGTLAPSVADANGSGSQRLYSDDDVRAARVLFALAELGARKPVLTDVAREVRAVLPHVTHLIVDREGRVFTASRPAMPDYLGAAWIVDLVALRANAGAVIRADDLVGVSA